MHYRWLSAFTHATETGYDIIERECGHPSWGARKRSHLLGELVLLYAATFAAAELRSFCQFVDRRPRLLTLSNRAEVEAAIGHVRAVTDYVWWPRHHAASFDRVSEANRQTWNTFQHDKSDGWPSASDPDSLPDDAVG